MKEVVLDIEKKYGVTESVREAPSKPSLIFPLPVDKSDSDSLISYVNQSLMTSSDGTKEVEWISFWYKNT